ncbi:MAG: glyoxalase/bleomycin resistance/dioxygenase family protein [Betaproteobacteria bacterium]|nr:MAG: glyoxalase/bleomycin resistance/dioxygenase family protein [Betaproteobacteria bacterium]
MKRFHVHVSVQDLPESLRFYSELFGAPPSVVKDDYAKWMLEDPRINFAISRRGRAAGVNHLGFQVDSDEELKDLREQVSKAGIAALDQAGASCCYAKSDKYWIEDPQGVAWETFHTLGSVPIFGEETRRSGEMSTCCVPTEKTGSSAACCS